MLAWIAGPSPARAQGAAPGAEGPAAGPALVLDAGRLWGYAESLLQSGEYYRAISEYKRLEHFFPHSRYAPAARVRMGEAWLLGGEPEQAATHFGTLLAAPELAPLRPELHYLRGLARLDTDRDAPYTLREPHLRQALEDLHAVPPDWPRAAAVQGFLATMEPPPDLPSRSPGLAGGLSAVVPGAGSFYVGNYSEGALALFVNALFIGATVRAHQQDHDDVALVLGAAALAFYGGNIYAAVNGAHRYNDRVQAEHLRTQRLRFGLVPQPGGIAGLLEHRF